MPAREGALRVLRAARDARVKRVVMTSSFAAIGYGARAADRPFTRGLDQSDGDGVSAYAKSKTLAERAAWDFIASEGGGLELSVVNPVGVFGPGARPGLLDLDPARQAPDRRRDARAARGVSFGIVDVRDVADLHLRAMTHPAAARRALPRGRRRVHVRRPRSPRCCASAWARRREASADAQLPNWLVRLASRCRLRR